MPSSACRQELRSRDRIQPNHHAKQGSDDQETESYASEEAAFSDGEDRI